MSNRKVTNLLRRDHWTGLSGESDVGPFLLRFRTPVLTPPATKGYDHLLTIVWAYADEQTREMPTRADSEEMKKFENRLCEALECDALAVLTAVLTFDGARQWVLYTRDFKECGERINSMPQEKQPYPIELTTERDPRWSYLRNRILKGVPKDAQQ